MAPPTSAAPPPAKKARVTGNGCDEESGDDGKGAAGAVLDEVWEHYRNYLDSESKEDDGDHAAADTDELYELIELATPLAVASTNASGDAENGDSDSDADDSATWTSRRAMLPVLLSVAYNHLADAAIAEHLYWQQKQPDASSGTSNPPPPGDTARAVQGLLLRSLEWFPRNAATWSMGANFARMTRTLAPSRTRLWYERAVQSASRLRRRALTRLERDDTPDEVREWIEMLVMNQILGVEYEEDDDDDSDDDDSDGNDGEGDDGDGDDGHDKVATKKEKDQPAVQEAFQDEYDEKQQMELEDEDTIAKGEAFENEYTAKDDKENSEREEADGRFSSSAVEATARFMCAMLWSMEGRHDRALIHLKHFPLTHRLHPNVWNVSTHPAKDMSPPTRAPLVFQPSDGILPPNLYLAMTKLFSPDASFWLESDYVNRGYFSFFMEYEEATTPRPHNLLEEVIVHHLLPRAQQVLDAEAHQGKESERDDGESTPKICGFEWWAHTRPIQANLGHNLHFDTDESTLDREGKVTHPILSSVLYLTGGETSSIDTTNDSLPSPAGATIILDQTPDSETVADRCWQGIPKDNSFLLFPGDRLHGVLPCPGRKNSMDDDESSSSSTTKTTTTAEVLIQDWKNSLSEPSTAPLVTPSPPHRLTFMVGFWTRNVPATMKERHLYGPCGPLPSNADEHTWVKDLTKGYDDVNTKDRPMATKTMPATALPCVSPAWECFEPNDHVTMDDGKSEARSGSDWEPPLLIPHSIDHRFFVRGAPQCFRQSLFEDRDIDC